MTDEQSPLKQAVDLFHAIERTGINDAGSKQAIASLMIAQRLQRIEEKLASLADALASIPPR